MGKLYQQVGRHLSGTFSGEVIVEIGSDRWEGSSAYFADLANTHNMQFISVDLDEDARHRLRKTIAPGHDQLTEFVQAEGTQWTAKYQGSKIRVLYLDNFDWDWRTDRQQQMIQNQVQWYQQQGLIMNNINSQTAHITQMVNLLPHMTDRCVVCVDDTYEYNGVFIGKGGAVVPYLLGQGFGILAAENYGVILGRGYRNYIV
jgi:cephalosporin hydroxylase